MMMGEMVEVQIPKRLHEELEKRISGSEFRTVSGYIAFVLTELIEAQDQARRPKEDDADLEERLKSLGYL